MLIGMNSYMIGVSARFKCEVGYNVVERFNKSQKVDSLEKYINEFENLKALMLQQNQLLPDSYFLDSFVGGLKTTLKPFVRAFKPTSISTKN